VLGLAGPFGTAERLNLVERLAYWGGMCGLGYAWGSLASALVQLRFAGRGQLARVLISTLCTTLGITALVLGLNALVFHWLPDRAALAQLVPVLFAICLIVTGSVTYLSQKHTLTPASQPAAPQDTPISQLPQIPLLDRLPLDKRAPLVALCVEDHYVRVKTLKGEEMLLMRLSDAIREVGETSGAQVHRSYWAAFDQVDAARKEGDRAILTMTTGEEIPVSRANLPKVRDAGLLPR
jgi:hypothetical protein